MNSKCALELRNASLNFADKVVFKDLSFCLESGKLACLLGPSGSGKTSLLRAICGLQSLSQGQILCYGELFTDTDTKVAAEKRKMGMVFQDLALFPHMTVLENIRSGLFAKTKPLVSEIDGWLERLDLTKERNRYPHELSGGQQQRVALARAMILRPRLMLLDEPFSNLDFDLRAFLVEDMRNLLKERGTTAILVTHDQRDAFGFADQVGLLDHHRLQQWDTPYNLYHMPANRLVADFIGDGVFVPGRLISEKDIQCDFGVLSSDEPFSFAINEPLEVLIRPDDVVYDADKSLVGRVTKKTFLGPSILYELVLESGTRILSQLPSHLEYAQGEMIGVRFQTEHLIAFTKKVAKSSLNTF